MGYSDINSLYQDKIIAHSDTGCFFYFKSKTNRDKSTGNQSLTAKKAPVGSPFPTATGIPVNRIRE